MSPRINLAIPANVVDTTASVLTKTLLQKTVSQHVVTQEGRQNMAFLPACHARRMGFLPGRLARKMLSFRSNSQQDWLLVQGAKHLLNDKFDECVVFLRKFNVNNSLCSVTNRTDVGKKE